MKSAMTVAAALVCGLGITLHAQDTKGKAKTRIDRDSPPVTFTGCVQSGAETATYILDRVVPVSRTTTTETTGTSGEVSTTSTSYMLVPGDRVELQPHVGRKVEVTGVLIPSGEPKMKTQTKSKRGDAPDARTKEETRSDHGRPQLRVISLKQLQEPC